jgi:hypothetical protein
VKVLIKNANDCLISKYVSEWYEQINGMPKLRTYKMLKTIFGVEDYVKKPMKSDATEAYHLKTEYAINAIVT